MPRLAVRFGLLLAALVATASPAAAQITINYDFNGNDPGYYTLDRQQAIIRAGQYVQTQFDGRGTINIIFDTRTSAQIGGSTLAVGGTFFTISPGTFSNGLAFQRATTNDTPFSPPDSFIRFNSNLSSWHTAAGTSVGSGLTDMQSVALHELTHGFGVTSLINTSTGSGLQGLPPGTPDTYSRLAQFLRLGNAANSPLVINPNGAFNTAQITVADLNGGNIFFHGEMAMAANGGSPLLMAGGLAHLSVLPNAVMLPGIPASTDRRTYQPAELGMLIDMGWNQFVWKNNNGNWADNISSTSNPQWENVEGWDALSPVGTITTNLVLRFGGTGSNYTSTNDLNLASTTNRFLVNRVILNAAAGGTGTIASNGTNILQFGTTIGITPLIRQDGAGAFNITHPMELTAANLQLGGNGAGQVNLNGAITGNGGMTKVGTSTFELGGTTANTYTGTTTVTAGVLQLNKTPGVNAIAGNVTLNTGGTLRLVAANQIQGDGSGVGLKVTLSGGTLSTGATTGFSDIVGSFEMTSSSIIALGTGPHNLQFTGITGSPTGTLTITGWSSAPGGGHVLFSGIGSNPNGDANFANLLATTNFTGFGIGATFLDMGGGVYELTFVPVPEPATVLAVASGAFGFGALLRRRFGRKGKNEMVEQRLVV